jgi:hypothetical protein
MAPKKGNHDPFNPENVPVWCPECQKDRLVPRGAYLRVCKTCGRTEVFEKPDRKVHGERPYKRLMARQKKKFGSTEGIALPQWIVKAKPEGEAGESVPKAASRGSKESNLLVKRLRALKLSSEQINGVVAVIKITCNRCWNGEADCECGGPTDDSA